MSERRAQLSDLLKQAEQLTADIQTSREGLPNVKRNLQQIAEAGQRLLDKTSGVLDESTDVKAAILLGSRGFDVPKLSQKLESLNAAKTLEPIEPVWETDIQGFLRNERENTLLAIIEESRKNTFSEAVRHHQHSMESEWETEKEKILNSLLGSSQDLEFPSESELMQATPLSMHGRSALDAVGMAYAREVYIRNEAELQGLSHSLVTTFHDASTKFVDKNVSECWALLKTMVDIPTLPQKAYEHRSSTAMQKAFVTQARQHLESRYLDYIRETVYRSLSQAQLGGVPGTRQLVKSYLNLVPQLGGLDPGSPWPMVFYCIRCGDLQDALDFVRRHPSLSEFAGYLQEYMQSEDRRLSPSSEEKLKLHYKGSVRSNHDPYMRAVYCLLARCDVSDNHSEVCVKTDDYMWLKLCQVQFGGEEDAPPTSHQIRRSAGDKISLAQLQHTLLEDYGESHFSAHQQPYLYFKVLLLTAQFEAAIEFLSRVEQLSVHAVHFAIALQDMELLHLTSDLQSKTLVKQPTGVRQLNFARLLISYTKRFALTDPREALQYYYLLKGMKGPQNQDLFSACVGDLVMESREFEMLLGRIEPDGSRRPGCIDKFQKETSEVISFVADGAEKRGLYEDAIRLHDLAKNHNKVLELLNQQLSHVASSPSPPHSDRERLQTLAITVAERYRNQGHNAGRQLSQTFFLLLDIMQFFDHYHSKRIDIALDVMKQLRLLPLQAGETVDQKVATFRGCSDEVRRCLPDILLATMNILFTQYKQVSASSPRVAFAGPGQDGGQEAHKTELRRTAKTLIKFAGMLPYQMPGDTNARLVQMEGFTLLLGDIKTPQDSSVSPHLDAIKSAVSSRGDQLTPREHAYIRAVLAYASGDLFKAIEEFTDILLDYPLDALAVGLTVFSCITVGEFERMRDAIARMLTFWTEDMELYPYILAFYGYSLEECRERKSAEKVARRALAINKKSPFAIHAMAHVIEETDEATKGVEFLTSTREDWTGIPFEGHIVWHLALYYLDLGEMDSLFYEFDHKLAKSVTADNPFVLMDAVSLLWRLNVMDIDAGEERWKRITDALATYCHHHRSPWFDAHIMMGLAHGKISECTARLALAQGMIKTMKIYSLTDGARNCDLSERLGVPVCNALLAFGQERYDEVLQLMLPLRYDFLNFGGSWTQRQVFSVTIIQAAVKANKISLALALVAELKAQKPKNKRLKQLFSDLKSKLEAGKQKGRSIAPSTGPESKRIRLC